MENIEKFREIYFPIVGQYFKGAITIRDGVFYVNFALPLIFLET
jgi:hypothetical protein